MGACGVQVGPQLPGRPDNPNAPWTTARTLCLFSGVRHEQLLRPNCVVEGFAQDCVNVVNGCPRQWAPALPALHEEVPVQCTERRRPNSLQPHAPNVGVHIVLHEIPIRGERRRLDFHGVSVEPLAQVVTLVAVVGIASVYGVEAMLTRPPCPRCDAAQGDSRPLPLDPVVAAAAGVRSERCSVNQVQASGTANSQRLVFSWPAHLVQGDWPVGQRAGEIEYGVLRRQEQRTPRD